MDILGIILLSLGAFYIVSGNFGTWRFKNFFVRLHPAGVTDSAGLIFTFLGLLCFAGTNLVIIKLIILLFLTLIASTTACHALGKAKYMEDKGKVKASKMD